MKAEDLEADLDVVIGYLEHKNYLDEDRAKNLKDYLIPKKAATVSFTKTALTVCPKCNVKYPIWFKDCPNCSKSRLERMLTSLDEKTPYLVTLAMAAFLSVVVAILVWG